MTQLRAARAAQPVSNSAEHEATLIGLTDPFSSESANARYPDSGAGSSLTFQQRFTLVRSTDANGTSAIAFSPKATEPYLISASSSGQVVTWGSVWGGDATGNLMNIYGTRYRPTSMGVRIANTLSATDSSGYLVIAKGATAAATGTTTFDPTNFSSYDIHPYTHGGEWHVVSLPRGSSAYDMQTVTGAHLTATNGDPNWECIFVCIFGSKASSSVVIFEIFINYEYIANEDAPIAQLMLPQPVLDTQMQTAINAVQSSHPTSHPGPKAVVKGFIKKEAKKALLKHVLPFVVKKGTQLLL